MDRNFRKLAVFATLIAFLSVVAGCGKKVASQAPASTPAPPAAQPTVTLNASPTTANAGDTVTLSWSSTNATDLDIQPGLDAGERDTCFFIHKTYSSRHSAGCGQSGAGRPYTGAADRIDDFRHHGDGCRRKRERQCARDCDVRDDCGAIENAVERERIVRAERQGRVL